MNTYYVKELLVWEQVDHALLPPARNDYSQHDSSEVNKDGSRKPDSNLSFFD